MSVVTRIRTSEELTVPFTPEEIWDVLAAASAYPAWWPVQWPAQVLSDQPGLLGSEIEVRPLLGGWFRFRFEELHEPFAMRIRFFGGRFEGPGGFLLQPGEKGQTRIRYDLDVFARGMGTAAVSQVLPLDAVQRFHMRSLLRNLEKQVRRQRKAAEARLRAEAKAARIAAEVAARLAAEQEARRLAAELEARRIAEAEVRRIAAAEAERRRAAEDARLAAEAEAGRLREEARVLAETEARRAEELRRHEEAELARIAAEAAARVAAEEEARRLAAELEARRIAEAEAIRIAAAEAERRRAAEDARLAAEAEAGRLREEARVLAETEARRAEELRRHEEAELARIAAEAAARLAAEEEARRLAAELEARRIAEAEAIRIAAAEAERRLAEEAARLAAEAEAGRLREEARVLAETEARRAEELRRHEEAESARIAAEAAARLAAEEEARRLAAELEARRVAEAEAIRIATAEAERRRAEEAARLAAEAEAGRLREEAPVRAETAARRAEELRRHEEAESAQIAAEAAARLAAEKEALRLAAELEARRIAEAENAPPAPTRESWFRRILGWFLTPETVAPEAPALAGSESNFTIARNYLAALSSRSSTKAVDVFLAKDLVRVEYPHRFLDRATSSSAEGMLGPRARASGTFATEDFELMGATGGGSQVAMEIAWSGRVGKHAPPLVEGQELAARLAVFLKFDDGRIVREHVYACFEPWSNAAERARVLAERAAGEPVVSKGGDSDPGSSQSNFEIARSYLAVMNAGAGPEEVAGFFAKDGTLEEFPNVFAPRGVVRTRDEIGQARGRGRALFKSEYYELCGAFGGGSQVAMEIAWTAVIGATTGSYTAGQKLEGRLAVFLKFRDGLIVRQRIYRGTPEIVSVTAADVHSS